MAFMGLVSLTFLVESIFKDQIKGPEIGQQFRVLGALSEDLVSILNTYMMVFNLPKLQIQGL